MIHIAIMKKDWGLIQKILSGEKTIETRWYKHKAKPWDCIKKGETIYFKDSGSPVTVKAKVSQVEQYEDLDEEKTREILAKYSQKDLGTSNISSEILEYINGKKYAIIVHLINPQKIKPFNIDKRGFGAMSAWLCVTSEELKKLQKPLVLTNSL
ncbi:hypothetical protein KBG31_02425 [Patescibacteria group bacterium]|nr:hypothetical protein [Patescibacteria group bacterium]